MLKRSLFGHAQLAREGGENAQLYYYFLQEQGEFFQSYGAQIDMQLGAQWENASVRNVTTSPARMHAILEMLVKNCVTPCTLQDIILEELNKY